MGGTLELGKGIGNMQRCGSNRLQYVLLLAILPSWFAIAAAGQRIAYPVTRRVGHVDTYFGVKVADPYRWLETDVRESKEVARWVAAENEVTRRYLDSIPERSKIRRRLTELWNYAQYSPPRKEGGRYYYFKNDGLQNQALLYVMHSLSGQPQVLLDPNAWSKDGTIALGGLGFSNDGRYLAYCRSEAGSDWSTWQIMEIASRKLLPDVLRWTKFTQASWTKDGKGFFYSRYERPWPGGEYQSLNFHNRLYYHRAGTLQEADELVYYRPEHPDWQYDGTVTDDGRWLVITTHLGTDDRYRVTVKDLSRPGSAAIELVDNFEHEYSFVDNVGSVLYFKSDLDAPRRRLVAVDLAAMKEGVAARLPNTQYSVLSTQSVANAPPSSVHAPPSTPRSPLPAWKQIIPQLDATLVGVSCVGDRFIASYLRDATSRVYVFTLEGRALDKVALPGIGTASGFHGKRSDKETFYSFASFATPPAIYRYEIKDTQEQLSWGVRHSHGVSHLFRRAEVRFRPEDYEVKQVFYQSKDGTRVPMFIAHKKGLWLNGDNPTLLYGYGGFNISLTPMFSVARLAWMEMGGVYAQPNLRGGGEYGEAWHKAGTKLNKQNVFGDFIAAAEWLCRERYTRPERLAIQGASNGGLLIGAVMTQRPELFGACLPAVGVMDMLRFQKFTEGRTWVDDYGSADNAQEFKALRAYSPYHNLRPGVCYPATLITTADTDDRVVPGHSFKFAAALQCAQACDNPVLIRISTRAGHGGGKPTTKRVEETADEWAFLVRNLKMKIPY
jgi:prolyl oligopeptidase